MTATRDATLPRSKRHLPVWKESILLLVVALGLAVLLKSFFVQAFYIPSESMEPGLVKDDRILVQKPSYWGNNGPARGDVVVFKDPGSWLPADSTTMPNPAMRALSKVGLYPSGGHLVKRVIGVAGDVITCCDKQGRLSVNGVPVDESQYVMPGELCRAPGSSQRNGAACDEQTLKVGPIPKGYLLVMGDNRAHSTDSTAHLCRRKETDCPPTRGLVPVDDVVGKVFVLVWPASRFEWINKPTAFSSVAD